MDKSNSQGAGPGEVCQSGAFLRHQQEFAQLVYTERESIWKYF